MELQAVWQKLDAALKSPVAVAEGPEHGGVSVLRDIPHGFGHIAKANDRGFGATSKYLEAGFPICLP